MCEPFIKKRPGIFLPGPVVKVRLIRCRESVGQTVTETIQRAVGGLVEAGPVLAGSVVEQRQFQRLITYVGSTWLGSSGRPVFDIAGPATMSAAPRLSLQDVTAFDNDVRLTYAMVVPPSATDTSQGRV